jgi:hypothetical protein
MEVLVAPARVPDPVRRNERKAEPFREIDERAVAVLLVTETMALELDVEPAREDRREPLEELLRGVRSAGGERARGGTLLAARQAVETVRVRRDLFEADSPLPFRAPERAGGDETTEIPVARPVLDEQRQAAFSVIPSGVPPVIPSGVPPVIPSGARNLFPVRERSFASLRMVLFERHLRPYEGFDSGLLCSLIEPWCPVDPVRVDERDGGKSAIRGLLHQVLRQ